MSGPAELAYCGYHKLPGQVWRRGDAAKHLGPPPHLAIPPWSQLFQTRCGLSVGDGPWEPTEDDDDCWCPGCIAYWFDTATTDQRK